MDGIFELVAAFVLAKVRALEEAEKEQGEHQHDAPPVVEASQPGPDSDTEPEPLTPPFSEP